MRSRKLKPGFFKNEHLGECTPLARLYFQGLWCLADRQGRLQDRPSKLRGEVLPFDAANGEDLLQELLQRQLVLRYQVDGQRCLWIPTFREHQKGSIHPDEAPSKLPPHPDDQQGLPEKGAVQGAYRAPRSNEQSPWSSRSSRSSRSSCEEGGKGGHQKEEGQERSGEVPLPQTVLQVPLPAELKTDAFWAHWLAYLRYRIDVGKPYRPSGAARQLARLAKWGPERACAAIAHTMAQEYLGIVEESGAASGKPEKKSRAAIIQEENDEWLRRQNTTGPGSNTTPSDSGSPPPTPPS